MNISGTWTSQAHGHLRDMNIWGSYRVAAINPEFSNVFLKITQHSWKWSDFIKVKKRWQKNISKMNVFNKIAVSGDNSLDPEQEHPEGPGHGVPVEGPHHLLHLRDQGRRFLWVTQKRHTINSPKESSLESFGARHFLFPHLWEGSPSAFAGSFYSKSGAKSGYYDGSLSLLRTVLRIQNKCFGSGSGSATLPTDSLFPEWPC